MSFEDHLERFRHDDGTYDLAATEAARAAELIEVPGELERLARKAAKQERSAWESRETQNLRKQFSQPALSPDLELATKVPLGDGRAVDLGDMNPIRIRERMDMRTKKHVDESDAYGREMEFWYATLAVLEPDETIASAGLDKWGAA